MNAARLAVTNNSTKFLPHHFFVVGYIQLEETISDLHWSGDYTACLDYQSKLKTKSKLIPAL